MLKGQVDLLSQLLFNLMEEELIKYFTLDMDDLALVLMRVGARIHQFLLFGLRLCPQQLGLAR